MKGEPRLTEENHREIARLINMSWQCLLEACKIMRGKVPVKILDLIVVTYQHRFLWRMRSALQSHGVRQHGNGFKFDIYSDPVSPTPIKLRQVK